MAVPPSDAPQPVRGFGASTGDLEALADGLTTCGITTIAMESTGVSWIPLFALLETRGFAVLLVDPQQVQKSKGRPTSDVHACQWIQRLHTFGLLAGAFRPDDQVCVLRSDLRQLVLRARCWKCGPGSPATTALVTGSVLLPFGRVLQPSRLPRPLPLFPFPMLEATMAPCKQKKTVVSNAYPPNEIGLDMSTWPREKQCTSWLGVAPHQRVSGGKGLRSRTRPTTNRAAAALRLAAASLHHSQRALDAYCRRMKSWLGTPKAVTATAHKLARLIYSMHKHGTAYVARGMDDYEQPSRDRVVKNLSRKARELGHEFVKPAEMT